MNYKTVEFFESGYWVRSIESEEDKIKAYRLRHQVFSEILGWVSPTPDGLEIDCFDHVAESLGLFSEEGILLGSVRLISPDNPFMLETDFTDLVSPDYLIRKETDTAEVSRLAITPSASHQGLSSHYLRILHKGIYQWSLENAVRYLYMETEERFWRVLNHLGFPCSPIGPVKMIPPGNAKSMAAILDWDEFRDENQIKRSVFLEWMTEAQSALVR